MRETQARGRRDGARQSASERLNAALQKYYPGLAALAHGAGAVPPAEIGRFAGCLKQLQRGLTGERLLAGRPYFDEADYRGAYLLYYWPVSFVQTTCALAEIRMRGALPRIVDALDLGAGPGPASFAAAEAGAERLRLVDSSQAALKAALGLKASLSHDKARFFTFRKDLENDDDIGGGPCELIVACHSANELWKDRADAVEKRARLLEKTALQLAEGGILLVIEPAANATSRPALALRDRLLENSGQNGLRCVAPCPGSHPCPMAKEEGRSCHSTWPWAPQGIVAELAARAGLDRDSAKATWFALKKQRAAEAAAAPVASVPNAATSAAGREPQAEPGPGRGVIAGRIVSEAMLNKAGRLRYILCTTQGLKTISAKADDAAARAAGFFTLNRGDCVVIRAPEQRQERRAYGFAADTRLEITLRAPRA